jgi:Flp pilus assembly protein TadD
VAVPQPPPPPPPPPPEDVAKELFTRAAALVPTEAEPQIVLGVLAVIKGDYEVAIGHMKAALENDPSDYTLWNKLGAVQTHSTQKDQAAESYRRALALRPGYNRAVENLKRLAPASA